MRFDHSKACNRLQKGEFIFTIAKRVGDLNSFGKCVLSVATRSRLSEVWKVPLTTAKRVVVLQSLESAF